jgi:hypothetical protein
VADLTAEAMGALIRRYFQACNDADVEVMTACFVPDGTHYFPADMYGGPFRGAATIARRWAEAVDQLGSRWTIDRMIVDAASAQAAIEWTHFKTKVGVVLRGDEWYLFDRSSGLIQEIRAYYASPQDRSYDRLELAGFDYADRGYPTQVPTDLRLDDGAEANGD